MSPMQLTALGVSALVVVLAIPLLLRRVPPNPLTIVGWRRANRLLHERRDTGTSPPG